jgi:hypothetical protein
VDAEAEGAEGIVDSLVGGLESELCFVSHDLGNFGWENRPVSLALGA